MKISYKHLVKNIIGKPSIEEISDRLFQLGHEYEVDKGIFDMEFTPNRVTFITKWSFKRFISFL